MFSMKMMRVEMTYKIALWGEGGKGRKVARVSLNEIRSKGESRTAGVEIVETSDHSLDNVEHPVYDGEKLM